MFTPPFKDLFYGRHICNIEYMFLIVPSEDVYISHLELLNLLAVSFFLRIIFHNTIHKNVIISGNVTATLSVRIRIAKYGKVSAVFLSETNSHRYDIYYKHPNLTVHMDYGTGRKVEDACYYLWLN